MKLEKDAVTIVGFSIIFILILLIITPPVLRLMFGKDEVNNSNNMLIKTVERLECGKKEENEKYNLITNINTIYEGNSINKITFTYNVELKQTGLSTTDIYISEFERLRQTFNALVTTNINSFSVQLDYSKNNYKYDEFLSKYSKDLSNQKLYYTSNGYICNVVR